MRIARGQLRRIIKEEAARLHEAGFRRPTDDSDGLSQYGHRMAAERASEFLDSNPPPYDVDEVAEHVARLMYDLPHGAVVASVKKYLATYKGIPGRGANRPGGLR